MQEDLNEKHAREIDALKQKFEQMIREM